MPLLKRRRNNFLIGGYETKRLVCRRKVSYFTIVPRNYNDFADICDQLINDDNVRLEMAIRNRKYVLEKHSVYSRYKQLQQILKKYETAELNI